MQKLVVNLQTGEQSVVEMSPEEVAAVEAAAAIRSIPQCVPMWTVRTVLQTHKLFDQAQALIAASDNIALKNLWEYGNEIRRTSSTLEALATALGLSSEQVDQLFIEAFSLSV